MCGILGTTQKIEDALFKQALDCMSHRGPDSSKVVTINDVTLGHKRLSIIDLSDRGIQPMSSVNEGVHIVFNGEIYNFSELKKTLLDQGVVFKSDTDTEVILMGYIKHGVSFFEQLRGMWAFAILDKRNNTLILSRDFFGIKPLYYNYDGQHISFASELRPLSAFTKFIPDKEAYVGYYTFGAMLFEHTGVVGVKQVLPGEVLVFNLSSKDLSKSLLCGIEKMTQPYRNLEDALSDSVKHHYISDVPVSILFSGGVDSTLLALMLKKQGFNPVCFVVEMPGSTDGYYARKIAKHIGLPVEVVSFNKENFTHVYTEVLSKLDIPISDISLLPTYAVFNSVKNKTKVALSGEGGDELFGGYMRHRFLYGTHIKNKSVILPKLYPDTYVGLKFVAPLMYRLQNIINKITGDTIATYATHALTFYDPVFLKKATDILRSVDCQYKGMFPDSLIFDMSVYLPYMLMLKGDRSSMFNSVEGRVPFLDKPLFSYIHELYSHGEKKLFFKEELKKILLKDVPHDLVYRKKQGFGVSPHMLGTQFKDDFKMAADFHKKNKEYFGELPFADLYINADGYDIVVEKYPRFAFGLITSFYIWKSYGL